MLPPLFDVPLAVDPSWLDTEGEYATAVHAAAVRRCEASAPDAGDDDAT